MSRLGETNDPTRQTTSFSPTASEGIANRIRITWTADGPAGTAPTIAATNHITSRLGEGLEPRRETTPFTPYAFGIVDREPVSRDAVGLEATESTTLIPGSWFRELTGRAVDDRGEPIEGAKYILAMGGLPTVGQVDENGYFSVYTLRSSYDDFMLVADSGRKNVDYSWYTPVELRVEPTDDDVTLIFEPRELKGLYAGKETDLGGSLR
ncbi:hypothetical protein [Natronococcus wangiae]|uniref:hypothetical protein n=1 Tax=Natronococcus wangiae TaxID=3068275 RepID=UPI00273EFC99|nr:hypothetical protein [Natronococcus sp. AD5]